VTIYVSMSIETVRLILTSALGIDDETYDLINEKNKREFEKMKAYIKTFRWYSKKKNLKKKFDM
jgi:hypothetical protein